MQTLQSDLQETTNKPRLRAMRALLANTLKVAPCHASAGVCVHGATFRVFAPAHGGSARVLSSAADRDAALLSVTGCAPLATVILSAADRAAALLSVAGRAKDPCDRARKQGKSVTTRVCRFTYARGDITGVLRAPRYGSSCHGSVGCAAQKQGPSSNCGSILSGGWRPG